MADAVGKAEFHLNEEVPHIGLSWIRFYGDGFFYRESPNAESSDISRRFYGTRIKYHSIGQQSNVNPIVLDQNVPVQPSIGERDVASIVTVQESSLVLGIALRNGPKTTRVYGGVMDNDSKVVSKWITIYKEEDEVVGYDSGVSRAYAIRNHQDEDIIVDEVRLVGDSITKREILRLKKSHYQQVVRSKNRLNILVRQGMRSAIVGIRLDSAIVDYFYAPDGTEIVNLNTDRSSSDVIVTVNSWTNPTQYWLVSDENMKRLRSVSQFESEHDGLELESEAGLAISHDNVEVPYTLIKKKGTITDPSTPAIIRTYGAFGISFKPRYDRLAAPWLQAGGILVYCHARGGGEKGPSWHKAGQGRNKVNSMLDTVACAEHLARKGISSSPRMVLSTGSAGGIISNWIIVHRPELFAAVVTSAGLGNISRIDKSPSGVTTQSEHGDPKIPQQRAILEKNDAYLHVKSNVYPACLYLHGFHDSRVPPWMSSKIAAKLRSSQKGSQPILMMTDFEYGHGLVGINLRNQAESSAKSYLFIGKVLGLEI